MTRYRILFLAALLALLLEALTVESVSTAAAVESEPEAPPTAAEMRQMAALTFADVNAEAAEPVTYEAWFRANAQLLAEDCKITHYCCERRPHICGTGNGITATGVPVTAGWTCAVDPRAIPYGAEVMVDYGDRVEFYKTQDCGGAVRGNHIDLAVETHAEAIERGVLRAAVYYLEGGGNDET